MWSQNQLLAFDATPLSYGRNHSQVPVRAVLIIQHGMGEHGARYHRFADYLSEMGVVSFLPDLRGHGKSGGLRTFANHLSDFEKDLEAVTLLASAEFPGKPLFIMGHSFGGLIASLYVSKLKSKKIQGLVLSSPIFGVALKVPFWKRWLARMLSYLFASVCLDTGIRPRMLTHDPEILREYVSDRLISHKLSLKLYRLMEEAYSKRPKIAKAITAPVLLIQAGNDPVVSRDKAVLFYHELSSPDKELKVYENFFHELLNESIRQEVYVRIGKWLLSKF